VFHFYDDHESDTSPHTERFGSAAGTAQTAIVSIPNSIVASHVPLPVTRYPKGKPVVGQPELDDDEDDGEGSIQIAYSRDV